MPENPEGACKDMSWIYADGGSPPLKPKLFRSEKYFSINAATEEIYKWANIFF